MRHGTAMNVAGNYVDSHGQSEIGFAVTKLLGYQLLPRIKQINKAKLCTASTEAILRRFTRNASHPVYRPCSNSAAHRKRSLCANT